MGKKDVKAQLKMAGLFSTYILDGNLGCAVHADPFGTVHHVPRPF